MSVPIRHIWFDEKGNRQEAVQIYYSSAWERFLARVRDLFRKPKPAYRAEEIEEMNRVKWFGGQA